MAIYLDGTGGNEINFGNVNFIGADETFTICFWFNIDAFDTGNYQVPFQKDEAPSGDVVGDIHIRVETNGAMYVQIYGSVSGWILGTSSAGDISADTDYFLFFVCDGSNAKLYINGSEKIDLDVSGDSINDSASATDIITHQLWNDARPIHGHVWDLRVYESNLSLAQMNIIRYSQGNDGITDDLVLWARMDEKTTGSTVSGANSVIDISGSGNDGSPSSSGMSYKEVTLKTGRANG